MKEEFGDFEEVGEHGAKVQLVQTLEAPVRVKLPRGNEVIGMIAQRLGGNRMEVRCTDGKIRNCRVPGRFKRTMWLRPRDIVLIKPWEHDNSKGDVIFKYNSASIIQLRKKGLLSSLTSEF